MSEQNKVKCPLLNKEIDWGYCWELCNIATDDILLEGDTVPDWDKALEVCKKCGRYSGESESPYMSLIFQRVNLRPPQLKHDTGDRGASQKQ